MPYITWVFWVINALQWVTAYCITQQQKHADVSAWTQHMDGNNLRGKKNRKFDLKFKLAVVKYAGR